MWSLLSGRGEGRLDLLPFPVAVVVQVASLFNGALRQNEQLLSADEEGGVSEAELKGSLVDLLFKGSEQLLLLLVEVLAVDDGVLSDQLAPLWVPHGRPKGAGPQGLLYGGLVVDQLAEVPTVGVLPEVGGEEEGLRLLFGLAAARLDQGGRGPQRGL